MISVLVVDDELPALQELRYLLGRDPRVGQVITAQTGEEALRLLRENHVDLVLLDIHMPGLSGLDIAGVLARFAQPPAVVFVTADERHAVEAYELAAVDYLLKPVRPQRLAEAIRRVADAVGASPAAAATLAPGGRHAASGTAATPGDPAPVTATGASNAAEAGPPAHDGAEGGAAIVVGVGNASVRVRLAEITHVTAAGDYARLHTARGSFLERTPLTELERRWAHSGFIRVHRSALVRVSAIDSVHRVEGLPMVRVAGADLPVARRALSRVRASMERDARGAGA